MESRSFDSLLLNAVKNLNCNWQRISFLFANGLCELLLQTDNGIVVGRSVEINWVDVLFVRDWVLEHPIQVRVELLLFQPWERLVRALLIKHSVSAVFVRSGLQITDLLSLEVLDRVVNNVAKTLV